MSEQEFRFMTREIKRLDGVHPAYKHESDPVRRAILRDAWRDALQDATGRRRRTTPGLGRRRKRPRR